MTQKCYVTKKGTLRKIIAPKKPQKNVVPTTENSAGPTSPKLNIEAHIGGSIIYLVQPKTSTFSTRALILVHFKTVH